MRLRCRPPSASWPRRSASQPPAGASSTPSTPAPASATSAWSSIWRASSPTPTRRPARTSASRWCPGRSPAWTRRSTPARTLSRSWGCCGCGRCARAETERRLAAPRKGGRGAESSGVATAPSHPAVRTFQELVLDFLAYLELERGLSRNTLEAYRSDLLQFGQFLDASATGALETTDRQLRDFITRLASGGRERTSVAPATVQRKVACLRSFYRHLRREGLLEHDPAARLHGPKRSPRLPHVLARAEVQRLLSQPAGTDPAALRDRALLELMYACGLRASEAISLEIGDVDLEAGILRARGKGSKERLVPVGRQAVKAVGAYLQRGRPRLVGDRWEARLFVNQRGGGLTRQGLYKIVQRHAATAGLASKMSPHTLR